MCPYYLYLVSPTRVCLAVKLPRMETTKGLDACVSPSFYHRIIQQQH